MGKVHASNIHVSAAKAGSKAALLAVQKQGEPRKASKNTFDSKSKSLSYMGDQSLEQGLPSADGSGVYYPQKQKKTTAGPPIQYVYLGHKNSSFVVGQRPSIGHLQATKKPGLDTSK